MGKNIWLFLGGVWATNYKLHSRGSNEFPIVMRIIYCMFGPIRKSIFQPMQLGGPSNVTGYKRSYRTSARSVVSGYTTILRCGAPLLGIVHIGCGRTYNGDYIPYWYSTTGGYE